MKGFIATLMLLAFTQATALTYLVKANDKACFYTLVDTPGKKVSFYFAVQSGGSFDIDYTITDPTSLVIHSGQKERQGDFVFSAAHSGEYAICFSNGMSTYTPKVIDFDITVQNDHHAIKAEFPKGSNAETDLSPLESSLYKLSGWLSDISRNQKYIRTRENRNYETVDSTTSQIFWVSFKVY